MTDNVDVLIVGAGAAGAAFAWSMSGTGLRILCLEQGGWMDPSRYPSTKPDWERYKWGTYHPSPNVRQLSTDYPIDDEDSPIAIANFNAVGGSTILFSGHFPRFHPSDFRVRTLDGVADDWPFDYEDLEPFYTLNDSIMGVSGMSGDPAYPPIRDLMPPVPLGRAGERLAHGFNQLGWHWWPSYSAIATRPFRGRSPCINLGPCNTGCPQGAKSSVDISYWPLALQNGVQLQTHARVHRITLDPQGRTNGVLYFDERGVEHFQAARIVILACNGIGTPRLLLNSESSQFPDGLANRSGQVGKNLMLHPLGYAEGVFDEQLNSHLGPQGCSLYSHQFYETDLSRGFVRGYTLHVLRGGNAIETALAGTIKREIPWGDGQIEALRQRLGHTLGISVITEDLPDETNEVTLNRDQTDAFGIPVPRIHYRLNANSRLMMNHGLARAREVLEAAGASRVTTSGPVRHSGWHLMGTTRMGVNPETSVVNPMGQCHDIPNLFIVDSSVFVTSAAVNPASTLQAIALYLADQIKKNLQDLLR